MKMSSICESVTLLTLYQPSPLGGLYQFSIRRHSSAMRFDQSPWVSVTWNWASSRVSPSGSLKVEPMSYTFPELWSPLEGLGARAVGLAGGLL